MASDAMDQLMKAIMRAEKQFGDDHRYRHVFGSLREARYAAAKISANSEYVSPGQREAQEVATKTDVPQAVDSRNPNVPDEGGEENGSASQAEGN